MFSWFGKGRKKKKGSTLESEARSSPPRKDYYVESSSECSSSDEDQGPPSFKKEKKKSFSSNDSDSKGFSTNVNKINVNVIHSTGTHIGNNINFVPASNGFDCGGYNNKNGRSEDTSSANESMEEHHPSSDLTRAFKMTKRITENDILEVKSYISKGWKKMGHELGYTEAMLNQFSMKYKPFEEVIHQLLLDWMRNNNCTIGILCTILWESEEHEAAERLASLHV